MESTAPIIQMQLHSQIHDFEVEHVVRPACVLPVSLQNAHKPFTSIGTFKKELHA